MIRGARFLADLERKESALRDLVRQTFPDHRDVVGAYEIIDGEAIIHRFYGWVARVADEADFGPVGDAMQAELRGLLNDAREKGATVCFDREPPEFDYDTMEKRLRLLLRASFCKRTESGRYEPVLPHHAATEAPFKWLPLDGAAQQ